jgi:hypothetical protein
MHNKELHNLYFSTNVNIDQIKDEIAARIMEIGNSYTALVDNTKGTKSFVRSRCKRKYDIKIDIKEAVYQVVEWIRPVVPKLFRVAVPFFNYNFSMAPCPK